MAERDGSGVGSARRRRERRLRAALRHEQQTVAMVLSAALHHSAQVGADVLYAAPRSQKTDRTAGRRPGVPKEPEPPVVVEHAVCPCSGAPLLSIPCLGGGADGVDVTTTRFLLGMALLRKEEEEEEVRRREEEEEELKRIRNIPFNQLTPLQRQKLASWIEKEKEKAKAAVGILPSTSSSSSGFIRKRKKKRRKRTRRRC